MKSSILVVGGAGYIGSHMAKMLAQSSHEVIVMDNLSTGFRDAARYGRLIEGDLADQALLDRIFAEDDIAAVLHFAALSQVGESMREPALYYRNNIANTQNLLDAMLRHHVRRFIFSSTAAIFGEPESTLIDEQHPQRPINPYGRSKRMVEEMLADGASNAFNLGSGTGFSVQEVIDTARRVTGQPIPAQTQERRAGDPAVLVADSQKARRELGWEPCFGDLGTIVEHAWGWEKKKGEARQNRSFQT